MFPGASSCFALLAALRLLVLVATVIVVLHEAVRRAAVAVLKGGAGERQLRDQRC
jgi:hypothetical protein